MLREQDVQLVGKSKMNSYEDCQARILIVWTKSLEHMGEDRFNSARSIPFAKYCLNMLLARAWMDSTT